MDTNPFVMATVHTRPEDLTERLIQLKPKRNIRILLDVPSD
jgi:hypothetical protein